MALALPYTCTYTCDSVESLEAKLGVLLPWNLYTLETGLLGVICMNCILPNPVDGLLACTVTFLWQGNNLGVKAGDLYIKMHTVTVYNVLVQQYHIDLRDSMIYVLIHGNQPTVISYTCVIRFIKRGFHLVNII